MKKKLLAVVCVITIALMISLVFLDNESFNHENSVKQGNQIAMYLEDNDGNYYLSSNGVFPTEGYTLNSELSSCKNGGIISQNKTTKKIKLIVKNIDSCSIYFEKEKKKLLDEILLKANTEDINTYEDGNKGEMFIFNHESTEQTTSQKDYRYIGNKPNNYVMFNEEIWRIVGVFETENGFNDKQLLPKLIRNKSIGSIAWDFNANEWSTSNLKNVLNSSYYSKIEDYSTIGLSDEAKNMIVSAKWYLGGANTYQNLGAESYYSLERGNTVYSNQMTSTIQNVGLIYPSDYLYTYANGVDDTCYLNSYNCDSGIPSNGWLFNKSSEWTIMPRSNSANNAFYINVGGFISSYGITSAYGIRPSIYINSNVVIVSGDGSEKNPYKIK